MGARVVTDLLSPYAGAADAWAGGPSRFYDRLASVFVDAVARDLDGATVLDVGAGTGAVCRALRRAGASPYALDGSAEMLAHVGNAAMLAVTGDMCALPFLDRAFDAALSAFAISHVETPVIALAEMRRVVTPGGLVSAAVFGAAPGGVSKEIVDQVAAEFGYQPPPWYVTLKTVCEPLCNTPELLRKLAASADLHAVEVHDITVDPGLDEPEQVVAYRVGLAHMAPFVAALPSSRRSEFLEQARAAVARHGQPVQPRVLILSGRAPAG